MIFCEVQCIGVVAPGTRESALLPGSNPLNNFVPGWFMPGPKRGLMVCREDRGLSSQLRHREKKHGRIGELFYSSPAFRQEYAPKIHNLVRDGPAVGPAGWFCGCAGAGSATCGNCDQCRPVLW